MAHEVFGDVPRLPARMVANLDRPGAYVPRLVGGTTDPDLGEDGEAVGIWSRKGHWIRGAARFLFRGTGLSGGSGQVRITLPFPVDYSIVVGSGTIGGGTCLGFGRLRSDASPSNSQPVYLQAPSTGTQEDVVFMVPLTGNASVTGSSPFTFATWTRIGVSFAYPADPDGLPR